MVKNDCVELLDKTEETQLKELLEPISLITDPLGQELIKKAAGSNSPIDVQELQWIQNGSRDEGLLRLYELEKLSIFTSSFEDRNGKTTRIFAITNTGRKTELLEKTLQVLLG